MQEGLNKLSIVVKDGFGIETKHSYELVVPTSSTPFNLTAPYALDINFKLPNGNFAMLSSVRGGLPVRIKPSDVWYAEPADTRLVNEAHFKKLVAALRPQRIYGLKLTNNNSPRNACSLLGGLSSLKILISAENRPTKAGIEAIAALPALEHLHLRESKISVRDLALLVQAKSLKFLTLERIDKAGSRELEFLTRMPKLEKVICIKCKFKEKDIRSLNFARRVSLEFKK